MLTLFEENKCPLCSQTNADIMEDHLVAFTGEHDYEGSPIVMPLCVNCHRVIHRCCWALISDESETILANYLALLESSLPSSLAQALGDELMAVKDSVIREYQRVEGYNLSQKTPGDTQCAFCEHSNPDFMEEHIVVERGEYAYLGPDVAVNVCANCHRVIIKFYEGKVLPTSKESKSLLHKYLAEFLDHLSPEAKERLTEFLQAID